MSDYPIDGIPAQIVPMVLQRIAAHIETSMLLEVPESNPTRAITIKLGRLQENPLQKNVAVAVTGGDYEDPTYLDGRIDRPEFNSLQVRNLPVGEIGGGVYWWRRGTIRFQTFFVRQRFPEDRAMEYAYDFYGRLLNAMSEIDVTGLVDDYGEKVCPPLYIEAASFFESGGGKDKFIWRGKLLWRVLTWRP